MTKPISQQEFKMQVAKAAGVLIAVAIGVYTGASTILEIKSRSIANEKAIEKIQDLVDRVPVIEVEIEYILRELEDFKNNQ